MVERSSWLTILAVAAAACGGSTFTPAGGGGDGGTQNTGGTANTGGVVSTGGTANTGGAVSTGGAANTGGTPGTGGTANTGGAAGGPAGAAECTTAADCYLFTDCCTCAPVKKTTVRASCNMACLQSDCAAKGIQPSEVACVAGRCVFDRTCDPAVVTCKSLPPTCAVGQAPLIVGSCYSGGCAPVEQCSEVASCDACKAAGLPCATFEVLRPAGSGSGNHCVTTPERCKSSPTCACMGVCAPFQCAQPDSTTLLCNCPTC